MLAANLVISSIRAFAAVALPSRVVNCVVSDSTDDAAADDPLTKDTKPDTNAPVPSKAVKAANGESRLFPTFIATPPSELNADLTRASPRSTAAPANLRVKVVLIAMMF